MRWLPQRLAPRLILALTLLVATVTSLFGWRAVRAQREQLEAGVVHAADQLSRVIASATWHAMLSDRREDAYAVMETIGDDSQIYAIRMFNKDGLVTFTTADEGAHRVDSRDDACSLCHERDKPLTHVDTPSRARIFLGVDKERKLAMVTPIYNEAACSAGVCHAHPPEQRVLGVLDVAMDLSAMDAMLHRGELEATVVILLQIGLMAILITFFVRILVADPIGTLIEGTHRIRTMHLNEPIVVRAGGEVGELASSFNSMREDLRQALTDLNQAAVNLEATVKRRSEELANTRLKLVQSDRLASLGQLSASVAHEINNPLAGVLNLTMLMQRILGVDGVPCDRLPEVREHLGVVVEQVTRVGQIVKDLLSFSRRTAPQWSTANLNQLIQDTLALLEHKLELNAVTTKLDLCPGIPTLACDAPQLQQVLINLVMNGAEATMNGGTITVRTSATLDRPGVTLEIEDDGCGISEVDLTKVFDPFFSTKEAGRGVGLGLSIVHGIVVNHGGTLDVSSEEDVGTKFTVWLPVSTTHNGHGTGKEAVG